MTVPIPILLYHSLSAEATEPYRRFSMDPGRFAEQMECIAAGGYTTLTVAGLVAALAGPAEAMPERPLVITVDDGFEDIHSVALPILTRLGLHATAYLVTGCLGGTSKWLTSVGEGDRPLLAPAQVRELDEAGIEIGAHGHKHVALDEISFSEAIGEIHGSGHRLEQILGHAVASFAYPYGYHTGAIKRFLQSSGFESACGVKQALSHRNDDRFALSRAIVGSDLPMADFDSWIRGEGLPVGNGRFRPQALAWRAVRRAKHAVLSRNETSAAGESNA